MATEEPIPQTPRLLSVDECAHALGCGRVTLFRLLKEHQLRRVKLGRKTLIPAADLAAFVASLEAKAS